MTSSLGRVFEYDERNRLKTVTATGGITVTYTYLDSGARPTKRVVGPGTTNVTLYLGDAYEERINQVSHETNKVCHVYFGGSRVASFTPITDAGALASLSPVTRFCSAALKSIGMDSTAYRWTINTPRPNGAGRMMTYVANLPPNPRWVYHGLTLSPLLFLAFIALRRATASDRVIHRQIRSHKVVFTLVNCPRSSAICQPPLIRATTWTLLITFYLGMIPPIAHADAFPRGDVNGD